MSAPTNPGLIPYHGEAVDITLPTVSRDAGYVPATIADSSVATAIGKQAARYLQYLDIGRPGIGDIFSDQVALSRGQSIEFPTLAGLGPLEASQFPTVYAGGCRIFFSQAILSQSTAFEVTFDPNARTYFYGSGPTIGVDQTVKIDVVALGDPPNPPAGFVDLGGVDTDATDITALVPSSLGSQLVVNADLLFDVLQATRAEIDASSLSGVVAMDITGTGDASALSVDGAGAAACSIITTDARALTASNNSPGNSAMVCTNADVTGPALTVSSGSTRLWGDLVEIGLAGTDKLEVVSEADFDGLVNLNNTTTLTDTLVVQGASGGVITTDAFGQIVSNGTIQSNGRLRVLGTTSSAAGDLSKDAGDTLQYNDGATKFVHFSEDGWVRGYGRADTIATGASAQLDTDSAVAPRVAADLDITCEFWIQRAIAGPVTIAINEVGGVGQVGTNQTLEIKSTGGDNWDRVTFSRTRTAADTVPYVYQLDVQGNGQNVTVHEARIAVLPVT